MNRWSLELKYAGRTFDLSDQVDVQLTASFSVFSGTIAEIAEVSFTLDLGIDIPAFVEAGYDLSGATGTLSLDGERVLVGRAIKPVCPWTRSWAIACAFRWRCAGSARPSTMI